MDWRLRVDVMERQRPVVFVDFPARDFAAQDAREDVGVIVVADAFDGHALVSLSPAQSAAGPGHRQPIRGSCH